MQYGEERLFVVGSVLSTDAKLDLHLQQNDISGSIAAHNGQRSCRRVTGVSKDHIALEVGELARLAAGDRLQPNI
jgi:hypothetical protein